MPLKATLYLLFLRKLLIFQRDSQSNSSYYKLNLWKLGPKIDLADQSKNDSEKQNCLMIYELQNKLN
jgi:hypothetical protein